MPELPEVETIKNILLPIVKGKTIKEVRIFRPKSIVGDSEEFGREVTGETFLNVTRRGKFLAFHLTNGKVIVSHLRMEGKYFEAEAGEAPEKHDILYYDFTDGTALRFNDVRKFGIVLLRNENDYLSVPPLSEVGKEPWDLTPKELQDGLKKKRSEMVKEALLDQSLIAGLGNIYDDEVLFAAKINPKREASSITLVEASQIINESKRILDMAIENGGSTIKSYHPKEGVSGMMQNSLLAYGQGNKPCSRCGTTLRKISIGGRGTVYCPRCQHIEGKPYIVGVTGPIASGKSSVADYLAKKGYEIIDADKIVSELYQRKEVQAKLKDMFPPLRIENGNIDRKSLADLLLAKENKKQLEAYIHPLVYEEICKTIASSHSERIALDVPLLINSPLEDKCDLIIGVFADPKVQGERLFERGKDPEKSLLINKGYPRGLVKKKCGVVLSGNGSLKELNEELDKADIF